MIVVVNTLLGAGVAILTLGVIGEKDEQRSQNLAVALVCYVGLIIAVNNIF